MKQINSQTWLKYTMLSIIGISLLLGMISQLSHTVLVYSHILPSEPKIYAWFFSISYDLFVGVAIMIGWRFSAGAGALIMALINVLCYGKFDGDIPAYSALLLSLIQPTVIFAYSTMIHGLQEAKELSELEALREIIVKQDAEIVSLNTRRKYNRVKGENEVENNLTILE